MKIKTEVKGYFISSGSKQGKNGIFYFADILDSSTNSVTRLYSNDDVFSGYVQFDSVSFPCICTTNDCFLRVDLN